MHRMPMALSASAATLPYTKNAAHSSKAVCEVRSGAAMAFTSSVSVHSFSSSGIADFRTLAPFG